MDQRYNGSAKLMRLRAALAEVHHDLNNPLAVISGNTQLLLEMARVMDLDEEVVAPIEDIAAAGRRLDDSLGELERLKEELPQEVKREFPREVGTDGASLG